MSFTASKLSCSKKPDRTLEKEQIFAGRDMVDIDVDGVKRRLNSSSFWIKASYRRVLLPLSTHMIIYYPYSIVSNMFSLPSHVSHPHPSSNSSAKRDCDNTVD